jgi:hypothetical protein
MVMKGSAKDWEVGQTLADEEYPTQNASSSPARI